MKATQITKERRKNTLTTFLSIGTNTPVTNLLYNMNNYCTWYVEHQTYMLEIYTEKTLNAHHRTVSEPVCSGSSFCAPRTDLKPRKSSIIQRFSYKSFQSNGRRLIQYNMAL